MPGIGKTTVIRRVADELGADGVRGFYTEEIREGGERVGFRLVGFEGTVHVIAHVDFLKRQRVGKYGVDVRALDSAMPLLRPDPAARSTSWMRSERWSAFLSASSRPCVP
jgi:nucleoside-triphosphatase